jgi:hypothetical protein
MCDYFVFDYDAIDDQIECYNCIYFYDVKCPAESCEE